MLHLITTQHDRLISYIKDDPVRPELSAEFRVHDNRFIATLLEGENPCSMVCVSLHDFIPASVEELHIVTAVPTIAVFYTIWSYKAGSGAALLRECVKCIKEKYVDVNTFVTLSPKTELARRFHIKNGAIIFRENSDTINYQYSVI